VPRLVLVAAVLVGGLLGCTAEPTADPRRPAAPTSGAGSATGPATPTPSVVTSPAEVSFDARAAMRTVRTLAAPGPREATSAAYREAAALVEARFAALGYDVVRQHFRVPSGVSWGIPVPAGRTWNVVARPPDWSPTSSYVVIGAHLDTVPQSPGADDNASGVAVLLELARLTQSQGSRLPVVLVAFGAEEPRRPGDDGHHYGSRAYTRRASLGRVDAMVSLDRVGAARRVPVCTGGLSPRRIQRSLVAAAKRVGVPARRCENRTSDHWPFEKAGAPAARVGGNPSPGYHSPRDRPDQVSRRQLARVGAVMWEWLRRR
jgi:hypothetical protein